MSDRPEVKPIVVPVNSSSHSEAALIYAVQPSESASTSRCWSCTWCMTRTVPGYYSRALKKKQVHRIEDGAADMLAEFLKDVVQRHSRLRGLQEIQSMLVKGLPSTRILEVAGQQGAGLIVLGSKGITGLKHLLIGSVANRWSTWPASR